MSREAELTALVARLTAQNDSLRDELAAAQRRARTWRWVAEQIFDGNRTED